MGSDELVLIGERYPFTGLRMKMFEARNNLLTMPSQHLDPRFATSHNQTLISRLPARFRNLREQRYRGEDFDISLSALSAVDQAHIRMLYGFVKTIHTRWLEIRDNPDWDELRKMLAAILLPPLSTAAKELGLDSMAHCLQGEATPALGKVLHDLRGGALIPLQLYARMNEWDEDPLHLRNATFLARDQAKIMRNILPDLDPEVRSADEAEKPHFIQAVVEKWDMFRFECADKKPGLVNVRCSYDGLLASCCLEASAIDRIVYNYMNNAMRFTAEPSISLEILPVGDNAVRWIVANPITPDQSEWLRKNTNGDLSNLFRGGLTRGGNGFGLSNCADFVAAAFGLPDINAALDGKFVGAVEEDGWFLVWAHWPALYAQEEKRPDLLVQ
jgi:signal transduction histidine kinase